jgi:alkylhydroperoxidase/carboxymuconolactone decarboxylase family protein YurZ
MAKKPSSTATARKPVSPATEDNLRRLSQSDESLIESMIGTRDVLRETARLDAKSFALVKIAALIAVDAPPASYLWQIGNAIEDGVTPEEIVGTMWAVAPQVGGPRVVAAAPEIMLALGLVLDEDGEA